MSAAKTITIHGLLAKPEASYNAGGAVAAADDGQLIESRVIAQLEALHDGARDPEGSRGTPYKKAKPSGRSASAPIPVVARGRGAAYAASVLPPDVHVFLRAAGHSSTVDATPAAETVTYAPSLTSPASLTMEAYDIGEKWPIQGVYCDMNFAVEAGGFLRFEFPFQGVAATDPVDASIPSITYLETVQPPKAIGMGFKIGDYTAAVVRRIEFALGREISPRADVNAADAHAGYTPGSIAPTLTAVIEAPALSGAATPAAGAIDPYKMFREAEEVALEFTVGSVQYNRIKFSAAKATLNAPPTREADGATPLLNLTFGLYPSVAGLVDTHSLIWS